MPKSFVTTASSSPYVHKPSLSFPNIPICVIPTTFESVAEVEKNGWECSLNHIDTRKITNMSYMFSGHPLGYGLGEFNGDISKWNVSNVENMAGMFSNSKFNNDISRWDVSRVENMNSMFKDSIFNQDILGWDVSNVENMTWMFYESNFN